MRELRTTDIFKMSKILSKINLKMSSIENKTATELGGEMILQISSNLHLAENEVNEFMADMIGCSPKEFAELPLSKTIEYINEFKNSKGIIDFLKLAGQLMK
jgi:hypothetical protein